MGHPGHYPCTFVKACHVRWAVDKMGWSLTRASIEIGLNLGTVSHIIRRRRYPDAFPIPLPGYKV